MQIKNNIKLLIVCLLGLFLFNFNVIAEEFNITAKEIVIDKDNETITGEGEVEAIDSEGRIINANKIPNLCFFYIHYSHISI